MPRTPTCVMPPLRVAAPNLIGSMVISQPRGSVRLPQLIEYITVLPHPCAIQAVVVVADANNSSASTAKPPSPWTRSCTPTNVAIAAIIHGRGAPRLACLVAKVCCRREVALWWWSMKRASRHYYPDCLGAFGAALRLTTVCPPTLVALASELPLRIRTFLPHDIPDGLCTGDIWQGV